MQPSIRGAATMTSAANIASVPDQAPPRASDVVPAPKSTPKTPDPSPVLADGPAPARFRRRHWLSVASFGIMVILPAIAAITYLFALAADQYHSTTAFSVRSEEYTNPLEVLGAFTQTGSGSGADNDILYDFITSQPLVEQVGAELPLSEMFNRTSDDPVFSLGADQPVEEVVEYWGRMVSVALDGNNKLIEVEVRAFDPFDARAIASAIITQSEALVNNLSQIAREDAMRYAREDLISAETRLKDIRRRVREFRNTNRIITPETDIANQTGVLAALEGQLAATLVDLEILDSYATASDPRRTQLGRKITAIRSQIAAEKDTIGMGTGAGPEGARSLSDVIGEYEELLTDLEFSETAYKAALSSAEQAKAEARRNSRYLAVHIQPTLSEAAQYPQRYVLSALIVAFLFSLWAVVVLIAYNIRDRR